jgi:hypothetical protein
VYIVLENTLAYKPLHRVKRGLQAQKPHVRKKKYKKLIINFILQKRHILVKDKNTSKERKG